MRLARHLSTESVAGFDAAFINQLAEQQPQVEAWDGYDADKTLFKHTEWGGPLEFGEPIQPMIDHVKNALAEGKKVKIFTARVSYKDERINTAVRHVLGEICLRCFGQVLEVTNLKDVGMRNLFDDRAWHVEPNTGIITDQAAP